MSTHVQMTVAEEDGIGSRGAYYDKAGALRDIVQNHMFQLLTLVAMEPPISFRAEDVRDEKVKVLHAVPAVDTGRRRSRTSCAVSTRATGTSPTSRLTRARRRSSRCGSTWTTGAGPASPSTCVPERSSRAATPHVAVQFKRAPFTLFRDTPVECTNPNVLVLRIQPDEGISLSFDAKVPGPLERLETVTMDFSYSAALQAGAVNRIRDAAVRRHDRRPDAVSPHGHGRGRLADRRAGSARVGARHARTGA